MYRGELLFRHGINPLPAGHGVTATSSIAVGRSGGADGDRLRRGKIHVVRPEHDHGAPSYGPGRPRTYVYRRTGDPCRVCGTPVLTAVLEGRNVFWCPTCQT